MGPHRPQCEVLISAEKTETETFPRLDPSQLSARDPDPNRVALVIGIENYKRMPEALYARTDANIFRDYAHRALGVPQASLARLKRGGCTRRAWLAWGAGGAAGNFPARTSRGATKLTISRRALRGAGVRRADVPRDG